MRVLVTGGAGYIGSHTCVLLLQAGHEVIVIDNLINSCEAALERVQSITGKPITFYKADLLNEADITSVLKMHEIDAVIHFAGLKAVGESVQKPITYYYNNITGTLNLIRAMKSFGIKKLVFSSSATVYGMPKSVPITEEFSLSATNPYGQTKLMLEQILKDIAIAEPDFGIVLLRYFNPIGAHQSGLIGEDPRGIPNNLMPYISQVAAGKLACLSVFGNDYDTKDGTGVRDYIHVCDLADGHLKALNKIQNECGIFVYNLGTGQGYSVLEMISAFEKASGHKVPYQIASRRPGDIGICYADPTKAEQELKFKAKYTLEDMCRDSWNWQCKNPNGYDEP